MTCRLFRYESALTEYYDLNVAQRSLEANIFAKQAVAETAAISLHRSDPAGNTQQIIAVLQGFQEEAAAHILKEWWDFFVLMVTKYRDVTRVKNFHADNYRDAVEWINYPRWWMEMVSNTITGTSTMQ